MTEEPDAPDVICPFCESTAVERVSRFGTEISKQGFYCTDCRSPFERLKYDGRRPDTGR
jgi:transposase-like protein